MPGLEIIKSLNVLNVSVNLLLLDQCTKTALLEKLALNKIGVLQYEVSNPASKDKSVTKTF